MGRGRVVGHQGWAVYRETFTVPSRCFTRVLGSGPSERAGAAQVTGAAGTGVACGLVPDREGLVVHAQHGSNCCASFCHRRVDAARFCDPAAPDAAPVAARLAAAAPVLRKRAVARARGAFFWDVEARSRRFDASATLDAFLLWLRAGEAFGDDRHARVGAPPPPWGGAGSDAAAVEAAVSRNFGTVKAVLGVRAPPAGD